MSATTAPAAPVEERTEHPHIVRRDGVATLRGSRIPVWLIAQLHRAGDSVDDIVRSYPHLSAAAVHDALSYFLDHRVETEREIAAQRFERVVAEAKE